MKNHIKIAMWSGPRNISTTLMRSFGNRGDTYISDEPFYAYFLKNTNVDHPLKNEIINKYDSNYKKIVQSISCKIPNNKVIWYQKQMTQHIFNHDDISWIKELNNCFSCS